MRSWLTATGNDGSGRWNEALLHYLNGRFELPALVFTVRQKKKTDAARGSRKRRNFIGNLMKWRSVGWDHLCGLPPAFPFCGRRAAFKTAAANRKRKKAEQRRKRYWLPLKWMTRLRRQLDNDRLVIISTKRKWQKAGSHVLQPVEYARSTIRD